MSKEKKVQVITDLGGRVIDSAKIVRYEPLFRMLVFKYFPAGACFEAVHGNDDLLNICRRVAIRALTKFDPHKAVNSISKNEKRKKRSDEDHLAWKQANAELVLEKAEGNWIARSIENELRRIRWENNKDQKGGVTIPMSSVKHNKEKLGDSEGANFVDFSSEVKLSELNSNPFSGEDDGAQSDGHIDDLIAEDVHAFSLKSPVVNQTQAQKDYELLLTLTQTADHKRIREEFSSLDRSRQVDVLALIGSGNSGGFDPFRSGPASDSL